MVTDESIMLFSRLLCFWAIPKITYYAPFKEYFQKNATEQHSTQFRAGSRAGLVSGFSYWLCFLGHNKYWLHSSPDAFCPKCCQYENPETCRAITLSPACDPALNVCVLVLFFTCGALDYIIESFVTCAAAAYRSRNLRQCHGKFAGWRHVYYAPKTTWLFLFYALYFCVPIMPEIMPA